MWKSPFDESPTRRGAVGVVAKNGFLFLCTILTRMSCVGRENFPKENPYVVSANHECFAEGVLNSKYLRKGHF